MTKMADEITSLERDIAQCAFEKLVIDELTEQFKWHEQDVKARFLESVDGLDGAKKNSDLFGDMASLSKVKGKSGTEGDVSYVGDMRLFEKWCRDNVEALVDFAKANADDFATYVLRESGEVVDGSKPEHFKTPDKPPYAKWNLKRPEMKSFLMENYGFELDSAMPNLLEGGSIV